MLKFMEVKSVGRVACPRARLRGLGTAEVTCVLTCNTDTNVFSQRPQAGCQLVNSEALSQGTEHRIMCFQESPHTRNFKASFVHKAACSAGEHLMH